MAIKFDGSSGLLKYLSSLGLTYPHSFTFYAAKGTSGANQDILFYGKHTGDKFERLTFADNGVNVYGSVFNPGTNASVIVSDPPLATFELYLVVFESTTSRKVYKNSTTPVVNTDFQADNLSLFDTFSLGGYDIDGGPGAFFNGHLAEVNVYAGAMSPSTFGTLLSKSVLPESISGHVVGFQLKTATDLISDDGSITLTSVGGVTTSSLAHPIARAGSVTPVSFSGTVPTRNGAVGSVASFANAGFFAGSATPFTYSVFSGTLPSGLTLSSSTGVISGTPTTSGTSSGIVIRATDTASNTANTNSYAIVIAATNASPTFPGSISSISTTTGTPITPVNVSGNFSDTDSLTYTASPAGTTWPSGLVVNSSTGIISGTPSTSASGLKVRATDTASQTVDSNAFNVTVSSTQTQVTITIPQKMGNVNTGSRAGVAVHVVLKDITTRVPIATKTGLTLDSNGKVPVFTISGPTANVECGVEVISDVNPRDHYSGTVTPT